MLKLLNIIKVALKNIINNKLRSILTILGLIIGIASVIVLVGIGQGSSQDVRQQVQQLGTDILTVNINSQDITLDYIDMDSILELENVDKLAPYKNISTTVSRNNKESTRASIIATTNNYLEITNIRLEKGRPISIIDIENTSKVCILGSTLSSDLFGLVDPIGEKVKLDGDEYTVIGILEESGSSMGTNTDNLIIIPFTTTKHLGSDLTISNIYIKVKNEENIELTKNIIENYLRLKLQTSNDNYTVSTQGSAIDAMEEINNTLSLLLGGIASISLIVGGIGVMNVMLVSVSERTREIGIRKSLGAKKSDILIQFLVEALVLSLLGGLLGVISGIILGNLANNFGYTFIYSTFVIIIAFTSSALIGLIFGIFPAYRAARLNPIDALRQE